jgi:hypothetical protein
MFTHPATVNGDSRFRAWVVFEFPPIIKAIVFASIGGTVVGDSDMVRGAVEDVVGGVVIVEGVVKGVVVSSGLFAFLSPPPQQPGIEQWNFKNNDMTNYTFQSPVVSNGFFMSFRHQHFYIYLHNSVYDKVTYIFKLFATS